MPENEFCLSFQTTRGGASNEGVAALWTSSFVCTVNTPHRHRQMDQRRAPRQGPPVVHDMLASAVRAALLAKVEPTAGAINGRRPLSKRKSILCVEQIGDAVRLEHADV